MGKTKTKKRKISSAGIGWICCVLFILAGIGFVTKGAAGAGFFAIVLGAFCCPKVYRPLKAKYGTAGKICQIAGICISLILMSGLMPEDINNDNYSISVENNASINVDNNTVTNLESNNTEAISMEQSTSSDVSGIMEVHFIDVGQGDATLIKCNGHNMLIDAGDNSKGTTVQLYLNKQNVTELDAVIWTHPDADHIGGADVITTKYNIGAVYMPDVTATTQTYSDLMSAINYRGYKPVNPLPGSSFMLGEAKVSFLGPLYKYDNDNDNSLVCMIEFGNNKFLFTGDAEQPAETALVRGYSNLNADVYKAGHHGSKTASSLGLLNAVNPDYVVISCGDGNSYGHPHAESLNNFRSFGYKVYRTDEQGSIVAVSDGNNINWNCSPSETWIAGQSDTVNDTGIKDNTENKNGVAPAGAVYIGNLGNNKLHKASCDGLPQTQNQILFDTLDEAVAAGYTSYNQCLICKPFGEVEAENTRQDVNVSAGSYIGNKTNYKLHKSSCSSLPDEKNRAYFNSKEEAVSAGYNDMCGRCHP